LKNVRCLVSQPYLDLLFPFYTAEPIGAIKELFITVDGKKVDPKKVTLTVRGQKIRLLNASTIYEVPWASYEVISVFIEQADGLKAGNHELECTLHLTSTTTYGGELKDTEGTPYREYFTKVTMILT